jgi:hypothetical protein
MRQQLEKMFPMSRPEAITNAIEKSVNVHEAVDILLGSRIEETGLIYTTGHQIMMANINTYCYVQGKAMIYHFFNFRF